MHYRRYNENDMFSLMVGSLMSPITKEILVLFSILIFEMENNQVLTATNKANQIKSDQVELRNRLLDLIVTCWDLFIQLT